MPINPSGEFSFDSRHVWKLATDRKMLDLNNRPQDFAHRMSKVTVGVCVKNCADLVGEAISSIVSQDFPHELIEVIFVDDGSEDNTLSIIQEYLPKIDMLVRIFHHEWKGLGLSRNVVVDNAQGEYIVWVDGDMRLSKDFVRRQVEYMEGNPATGIGKGKYSMSTQANLVSELENIEFASVNLRRERKAGATPLGTGGSIYRIKAIRQVGGFDEKITGSGEDQDIEHRISAVGWALDLTSAVFYETRRKTLRSLWNEYFWHGTGGSYLFEKNMKIVGPYKFWPPVMITIELLRVRMAYRATHRKLALLLPILYVFKRTAWLFGFVVGRLETKKTKKNAIDYINHVRTS